MARVMGQLRHAARERRNGTCESQLRYKKLDTIITTISHAAREWRNGACDGPVPSQYPPFKDQTRSDQKAECVVDDLIERFLAVVFVRRRQEGEGQSVIL